MSRARAFALAAALLTVLPAVASEEPPPLGFAAASAARQRGVEAALIALPSASRAQALHAQLTRAPHVAGTEASRRLAGEIAWHLRAAGLETEVVSYDVLLSWPRRVEVALVAPRQVRLARPEAAIPEDPWSSEPSLATPWHAYARSGDVTAEVVYVNHGRAEDYEELARRGIDVRGKIALARYFKGYRGGKSLEAERRGVAALITYSDPAEDGYVQGDVYPKGPWGPDSHFQRGANVYDFIVPGDPLTPGWASVAGARRIAEGESEILPRIPSVPLSFQDAREILQALEGPVRPDLEWQGGGPFTYHLGPGPAQVRLSLDVPREVRTIRNVIARLPGADPDPEVASQIVLLSNHHDAWTYGGVDPSSGTASAIELGRALGELSRRGMRPRRTIVLGIWDAEEFTLTGSTEWGEEHADVLRERAVACLNVDSSTSGDRFALSAVPSLRRFFYEVARRVEDPRGRGSVYDVWRAGEEAGNVRGYGVAAGEASAEPPVSILGSGSDYTVFFNHLGVPSADFLFDGPYGVYHSIYDSHEWMKRHGDPGFRYHAAMAALWGVAALRLANADVLPFDYATYGRDIGVYLDEVEALARLRSLPLDFSLARAQARRLAALPLPSAEGSAEERRRWNQALLRAERDLTRPEGLPGRPWFRHLVYAPLPSYAAETLPGVREAVIEKDAGRAAAQARHLGRALEQAADRLEAAARP
ncbi:MAG TPA: M28 family metallopeptidase [Vicinamibacteria bacterium]|nr:M28 family metallopeptidase [Vicinamibacteria bacterium]